MAAQAVGIGGQAPLLLHQSAQSQAAALNSEDQHLIEILRRFYFHQDVRLITNWLFFFQREANKYKNHLGQKARIQTLDKLGEKQHDHSYRLWGRYFTYFFSYNFFEENLSSQSVSKYNPYTHVNMLLSLWCTEIHWKLTKLIFF